MWNRFHKTGAFVVLIYSTVTFCRNFKSKISDLKFFFEFFQTKLPDKEETFLF